MKNFIDPWDFSTDELMQLVDFIILLKKADKLGACPKLLEDASLGMIFAAPSTRTRVSFEVAMTQLGGHALYLRPGELHLGSRESIKDTALVLSRMVDCIMARIHSPEDMEELSKWATVPVINGMTDYNHPTQALCDLVTIVENMPEGKTLADITLTFVGDTTLFECVLNTMNQILPRFGGNVVFASPKGYSLYDDDSEYREKLIARAEEACKLGGGTFTVLDDPIEAVKNADFIYTGPWTYHGNEHEKKERDKVFMPKFQVNEDLISHAPDHAQFMHYGPALRGVEMSEGVMDHERSLLVDEAENRLHTEKGLLAWYIYPNLNKASAEVKAAMQAEAELFLLNAQQAE
ncbi:MAG: ornithine carbamoyltransferase [Shimia sp.]|nr:ornithine carbamoyltransferase [Shimia sp.]